MKYTPHSSDEVLIMGCREQNRLAQKYLYQRYYGKLLGVCMRYTSNREEAISILNMAFFKIFQSIDNYNSSGSFKGWMSRIALNTSIDHLRSNTTYRKVMDYNSEKEVLIENDAIDALAAEELYALIQQLPTASRSVFSLYVIEGYKHHEIAEQLGISVGTSKWHLSSARKQLQKLLKNLEHSRLRS
ncbi:MAG: sigma-70 family RNA polymerase sigma factor [Bacteroidota bacterium]